MSLNARLINLEAALRTPRDRCPTCGGPLVSESLFAHVGPHAGRQWCRDCRRDPRTGEVATFTVHAAPGLTPPQPEDER